MSGLPPALETARLILRPFVPGDLEALAALYADAEVMAYRGAGTRTYDESAATLAAIAAHYAEHGYGVLAVRDHTTGAFLGEAGLRRMPEIGETEVRYVLAREAWGKGLAAEAARAAIADGFGRIGLRRIVGFAWPGHMASRRVLEKAGLGFETVRSLPGFAKPLAFYALEAPRSSRP